jgi:DNA-binding transcriptional MocR family regulator
MHITQLELAEGMIDLGVGQPDPALLPLAALRQAAADRLGHDDPQLLAYGAEQGNGDFRIMLAEFLSQNYGIAVEDSELFVTTGVSQALDMVCTLFAQPGDTILVEEPTYFLALRIFADHQLRVIGVPTDDNGLIIDALEEQLAACKPAFLYTIPTFHNPAAVSLPVSRRQQLVRLSQQHDFLIVADEVYHLLAYTESPPAPLASYVKTGTVLSLGSFSKILAPGLRLGWIQAGPVIVDRLVHSGVLDSGGGLNPFTSAIVQSVIELGLQKKQLGHLNATYHRRAAALSQFLRQDLPGSASFSEPGGGFFIWLRLPDEIDAAALLVTARQQDVGFQPGVRFSSSQGLRNYARLSFAYYDLPELEEGTKRLASVLAAHLAEMPA